MLIIVLQIKVNNMRNVKLVFKALQNFKESFIFMTIISITNFLLSLLLLFSFFPVSHRLLFKCIVISI